MLERCLKILQNIACFQELHLSFARFDVSYCGVPLPEELLKKLYIAGNIKEL
jgi:hypothetical protein